jgi:hypothetical protein
MIPNMDWKLLRNQKDKLAEIYETLKQEKSELEGDFLCRDRVAAINGQLDALEGTLRLIDYIQDEADANGEIGVYEEEEPARKERRYEICVTRTYSVSNTYDDIVSDSQVAAVEEAENRSGNEDNLHRLQLVDVDVDVYSEEIV